MSSQPATLCVTFSVISGVFAARKALSKLLDGLAPLNLAPTILTASRWYWPRCSTILSNTVTPTHKLPGQLACNAHW